MNLMLGLFIDNICAKGGFRHVSRMLLARCAGALTDGGASGIDTSAT